LNTALPLVSLSNQGEVLVLGLLMKLHLGFIW